MNCLIGANGVGKSNVLEGIGILGAASNSRVDDEAIMRRGVRVGLPRLCKTSFASERIGSHIAFSATLESGVTFEVTLLNPLDNLEPAWSFKTEGIRDGQSEIVVRGVRSEKEKLVPTAGLSAPKCVGLSLDSPAARPMNALQPYTIYSPNTQTLRGTVPVTQIRAPIDLPGGGLAEGFIALQSHLDTEALDSFLHSVDWGRDVSAAESAGTLLSPSVPRSKLVLTFVDRFMAAERNTLTAYDANEGALYDLFAAVLCLSPNSPKLFAVDNLGQALNPGLIARLVARLAGSLESADTSRRLVFTANNPAVLDGLALDSDDVRLFAIERNSDGHTCRRRITLSPELRELNETYPLSRLWFMANRVLCPMSDLRIPLVAEGLTNGCVSQACHRMPTVASSHLRAVLVVGHVTCVVKAVLDVSMLSVELPGLRELIAWYRGLTCHPLMDCGEALSSGKRCSTP